MTDLVVLTNTANDTHRQMPDDYVQRPSRQSIQSVVIGSLQTSWLCFLWCVADLRQWLCFFQIDIRPENPQEVHPLRLLLSLVLQMLRVSRQQ